MLLRFFWLLISASLYGQVDNRLITVEQSYLDTKYVYQFDATGKLLEYRFNNNKEKTFFKFDYQDSLIIKITNTKKLVDTSFIRTYDFVYNKNRKLVAQKSSEEDSIKFFYDSRGRVIEIKNYYGDDVQNKYLESGDVYEKISNSTDEGMSAYYDITKYTYEKDKIIEEKTFYSPCKESKFITIKTFKDGNLLKELSFYPTNEDLGSVVKEYTYTKQGFLKAEINNAGIKNYDISGWLDDVNKNVIMRINNVLIGDFKSIRWY